MVSEVKHSFYCFMKSGIKRTYLMIILNRSRKNRANIAEALGLSLERGLNSRKGVSGMQRVFLNWQVRF
jgi:hypothetical protein